MKIRLGDLRNLIREFISSRVDVDAHLAANKDKHYINTYGPLAGPENGDDEDEDRMLNHLGDSLDDDEEADFGPVPPMSQEKLYASMDPFAKDW